MLDDPPSTAPATPNPRIGAPSVAKSAALPTLRSQGDGCLLILYLLGLGSQVTQLLIGVSRASGIASKIIIGVQGEELCRLNLRES